MQTSHSAYLLVYLLPMIFIWLAYRITKKARQRRAESKLRESQKQGIFEPPSLHPEINPALCMGCSACVHACPEGDILGLIGNKATLVQPSHCIGHGACRAACPFNAISLVFGTATRGVDIPLVSSSFETSVKGIYIAGELGGMGLIKNALTQGVQAVAGISRVLKAHINQNQPDALLDLIIVGAGPAGIAASLKAKADGLQFVTLEQNQLGGTVSHYPRNKIVMTSPVTLPLAGKFSLRETSKEALLSRWQQIVEAYDPPIHFGERLTAVSGQAGNFTLTTTKTSYRAKNILLCIGRRGTPRQLDVPGEELPKVVYQLIDSAQYVGQDVLIVGGGDSALEAAIAVAEESNTSVTLCYRGKGFSRAKPKNTEKLQLLENAGRVTVLLEAQPVEILAESVVIIHGGRKQTLPNDAVIICAGGILPTPFLQSLGIEVETKYGTA